MKNSLSMDLPDGRESDAHVPHNARRGVEKLEESFRGQDFVVHKLREQHLRLVPD